MKSKLTCEHETFIIETFNRTFESSVDSMSSVVNPSNSANEQKSTDSIEHHTSDITQNCSSGKNALKLDIGVKGKNYHPPS